MVVLVTHQLLVQALMPTIIAVRYLQRGMVNILSVIMLRLIFAARMQYQNISLEKAANTVINDVLVKAGGSGGIIAIDKYGNITMPFNTSGMYRASRKQGEKAQVGIFK